MNRYDFSGYVGMAGMITFNYTMSIPFALAGFALLTVQAIKAKMWNLVILNIIGSVGLTLNLLEIL